MSCVNRDSFTFSFPIGCLFFWLGELIALAGIFSTTLSRSGKVRHLCLILYLREENI